MAGKLTTHVLDTAQGCPGEGIAIALFSIGSSGEKTLIKTVYTNADGRTDTPLLSESEMQSGVYELTFTLGEYFARQAVKQDTALPNPPFLDRIPLQFGIADINTHYHVPLLVSPWSYSTYRGS
ncbi:MAG TPA: hydroxyisourate hydrolase [Coleofasciculaceae cyanobacterium]|jgi:5-hydroxyisourate hydrolase